MENNKQRRSRKKNDLLALNEEDMEDQSFSGTHPSFESTRIDDNPEAEIQDDSIVAEPNGNAAETSKTRGKKRKSKTPAGTPAKTRKVGKGKKVVDDIQLPIESTKLCGISEDEGPLDVTAKGQELWTKFHKTKLWEDEDVVAESTDVSINIVKNVINLLDQECTIPFIARYRKHLIGGLEPEKLRDIQMSYHHVKQVHKKVENVLKTVTDERFNEESAVELLAAKNMAEVEFLCSQYKKEHKGSLAERAKQLGLEPIALEIMNGKKAVATINFNNYINPDKEGLQTIEKIKKNIQNIIAHHISKNRKVLDLLRKLKQSGIRLQCKKSTTANKREEVKASEGKAPINYKFENYFNFDATISSMHSHQVLAINRGETLKVLTVKVDFPQWMQKDTFDFIWMMLNGNKGFDPVTLHFLTDCIHDSYDRLIKPFMTRHIRSDLTKRAEKESIQVFCNNLTNLLLTPPVRGKIILGVDPGFTHGCKLAVVSPNGEVKVTGVIYPHSNNRKGNTDQAEKLRSIITNCKVEVIAIGNGTACRQTEKWISDLIQSGVFKPLDVKYCIIDERGVSIYSVTKEAEAELPKMDPNLRSAVSIARRLQDPLLEHVKVEPKHLGIGQYQHDISDTLLRNALDGVVTECVSNVGVDLNVCSEVLLRKISGLSASKAKNVIQFRETNGCFINRGQLKDVKGLGPKSFEQCAGFVKILPETSQIKNVPITTKKKGKKVIPKPNPLDRTIIHPESYSIAEKFIAAVKADINEIGKEAFVNKLNAFLRDTSVEVLATKYNISSQAMQLIVDALKNVDYDIRQQFAHQLFRSSVLSMKDLEVNQVLTGRVNNVTTFGAFVDIGVERNGLIHVSQMNRKKLSVGDRVKVTIKDLNTIKEGRIPLKLLEKLEDTT